jgi:benzodiazapine receptor
MSFLYPTDDDDPKRAARRPLLAFILVTLLVGAGASVFAQAAIPTWYAALRHPAIAPPNWLFAPVWTTLYVLMAVAAWRVWRITGTKSPEMAAYAFQLFLNFTWCAIFFGLHRIGFALTEIIAMDLAVLATAIAFFRRDRLAGLLMLSYLGWALFAAALNQGFWALNP